MSSPIIYVGPRRIDLNLHFGMLFPDWEEIPERIAQAMQADSAFANHFQLLENFMHRPPPGSNAFEKAKIASQPPKGRTLVHPPLRRHR